MLAGQPVCECVGMNIPPTTDVLVARPRESVITFILSLLTRWNI